MTAALTQAKVERGATLFDEIYPDWHNVPDLETLDLVSPIACLAAQLYGVSYFTAVMDLFPFLDGFSTELDELADEFGLFVYCEELAEYGHCPSHSHTATYNALTEEWKKQILARRNTQLPKVVFEGPIAELSVARGLPPETVWIATRVQ